MKRVKGWIALDVDGTITDNIHEVPDEVVHYLKELAKQGWRLLLVTGRTFSFGYSSLKKLDFPYFFSVQNGADILEMPERKLISRAYLSSAAIPHVEQACKGQKGDFVIYAGYEKGDFCYFRPSRFSPEMLLYLKKVEKLAPEPWKAVEKFVFGPKEAFPLIKCFGDLEAMKAVHKSLEGLSSLHTTLIRDRVDPTLFLNLVTDTEATKGKALKRLVSMYGKGERIIAGGDDQNDLSLLMEADVRIVMETAPQEVLNCAHIIAPPASKLGIIKALEKAIKWD